MQHPDEGTIHSWLDGALSADEAAGVEAHVKDCPQCAVAVAEARGFIAASSRILTALDNAPRGVIPVAAPKRRVDPIVWRVAATLLVVAAGTFAVFRNGGREAPIIVTNGGDGGSIAVKVVAPSAPDEVEPTRTTAQAARPIRMPGNPAQAVAGGSPQSAFSDKGAAKTGAADMSTATEKPPTAVAPPIAYSAPIAAPPSQANLPAALYGKAADRASNTAAAPSPRFLPPAGVGSVAALDAASEPLPLKIVGKPRQIGARITLYEVAPGDTVALTEVLNVQLESMVVTGLSTARTATQPTEKSAVATAAKGAVAPTVSASDSQGAAGIASPAPAQAVQAGSGNVFTSKTGNVQVSNGVTTISWTDPVTRNVMKLSGRMPEARLQQIKIRIERERAAAAAKKQP